jgi:hypothetical protein
MRLPVRRVVFTLVVAVCGALALAITDLEETTPTWKLREEINREMGRNTRLREESALHRDLRLRERELEKRLTRDARRDRLTSHTAWDVRVTTRARLTQRADVSTTELLSAADIEAQQDLGVLTPPLLTRVESDLRVLARGLEAYALDHYDQYPASTTGTESMLGPVKRKKEYKTEFVPGMYRIWNESRAANLTTPVPYIMRFYDDAFTSEPKHPYAYFSTVRNEVSGWVLFSVGPDGEYDLTWDDFDPSALFPSRVFIEATYDPTNGVRSRGDVWRIGP